MGNNTSIPIQERVGGGQQLFDFGAGDMSSNPFQPKPEYINRNFPTPNLPPALLPNMQYSQNAYYYENKYNHMKTNLGKGIQMGLQSLFSDGAFSSPPITNYKNDQIKKKTQKKPKTVLIKPERNGQIPGFMQPTLQFSQNAQAYEGKYGALDQKQVKNEEQDNEVAVHQEMSESLENDQVLDDVWDRVVPTSDFDPQRFFTDSDYKAPMVERNQDIVKMYAGGGSSGTISDKPSWGSTVLDQGGNGPPTGGNSGGGGGEGPGENSNDGKRDDNRRITSAEKQALKGRFIKQAMILNLGQKQYESLNKDPFKEIQNLITAKTILEDPSCPYEAAFDLQTKRIHFYTTLDKLQPNANQFIDQNLTNASPFQDDQSKYPEILLNHEPLYTRLNMIRDNSQETLNELSTLPGDCVFVPYEHIYQYVGEKLKIDQNGQLQVSTAGGFDPKRIGGLQVSNKSHQSEFNLAQKASETDDFYKNLKDNYKQFADKIGMEILDEANLSINQD